MGRKAPNCLLLHQEKLQIVYLLHHEDQFQLLGVYDAWTLLVERRSENVFIDGHNSYGDSSTMDGRQVKSVE